MKSFGLKAVVLPAAVAASLAFAGGQANAQGLFDIIFGGPVRESPKLQGKFPPAPKPRKPSTGGGARISAPTYATYRAPALVKVNFASLIDAPLATGATNASVTGSTVTGSTVTGSTAGDTAVQNASFQPGAAPAFHDALSGLDGYDLFAEPDIGKALVAYYTANPDFIWVTDGEPNARARDAIGIVFIVEQLRERRDVRSVAADDAELEFRRLSDCLLDRRSCPDKRGQSRDQKCYADECLHDLLTLKSIRG